MKNLFFELSSKELKDTCGIYVINIGPHKYVGSSKSLYARLNEHRVDLSKNDHSNEFMQRAFNKYYPEFVLFYITEYCNEKDRIQKEKYWIDYLKADMNLQDPVTKELSKRSRQKISTSLKKAYATGKRDKPVGQPIEVYDIYGNFKEEYESAKVAAETLKMNEHTIQIAANKYYAGRVCGLLRFRYKYSKVKPKKFDNINYQKFTAKFKYTIIEPNGKVVSINAGIKHVNKAILEQLLKGNLEFIIKADPRSPL